LIKSMTAYGRAEYALENRLLIIEIRSLNNRYRDIILRMPNSFQPLDKDLRTLISSRARRGRIEVSIQMEMSDEDTAYRLELNMPLVSSYFKIFDQLSEQFGLDGQVRLESFCQMKDVVLFKPQEGELEEVGPGVQEVMKMALDSLDAMKIKEGEAIESDFVQRLCLLDRYVDELNERVPKVVEEYRRRLEERIHRILEDVAIDENRLTQEVAFFAERSDITEEVVRIRSHLKQFRDYLSLDDALGRRLDFLVQEINREVNTVGSKASDSFISGIVVEMKAELEKLREQIQNVE